MKTITDVRGHVYALDDVVAIRKGGTPHTDFGLPREPVAVLVYATGATVETLVPHSRAVSAWTGEKVAPEVPPVAEQSGTHSPAAGEELLTDAEAADVSHI